MCFDIGLSNIFLDISSQVKETEAKIIKWDYIRLKSFCTVTKLAAIHKRPPTEWEKIFSNDISDKGIISKIYKEFIKLNTEKTNNLI